MSVPKKGNCAPMPIASRAGLREIGKRSVASYCSVCAAGLPGGDCSGVMVVEYMRRSNGLHQEEPIDRVLAFVPMRIAERREELLEFGVFRLGHLNADEDRAVVRALVPILEEADVPVRRHRRQELHQRARPFREFEAEEALVVRERRAAARHGAEVALWASSAG